MKLSRFRIKLFAIHLLCSIVVAVASLYVVFVIWHPTPLAKAVGVTDIFLMMLAIDVILGPLLTLITAKKGKKTLKLDLAIIVILQIVAFMYGMQNIAMNRPVYIAFDTNRFDLVQANSLLADSLSEASPAYRQTNWGKPKMVAIKVAKDDDELNKRRLLQIHTGISTSVRANLYEPFETQQYRVKEAARTVSELSQYNNQTVVDKLLKQYSDVQGWLPLRTYNLDMTVLINTQGEVIDIVDLRPWSLADSSNYSEKDGF